ncbi:MAG: phage major tail tube protein [Lachnospiraceae bacterium]|nr:phage major tail tube protein [Lachnospiraceae bacterium]
MQFIDKTAAVEASSFYCDKTQIANDIKVTLPEIVFQTVEADIMGAVDIPVMSRLEAMETSATINGMNKHITTLCKPGKKNLDVRWLENIVDKDGNVTQKGRKALMQAFPKKVFPGGDIEPGNNTDYEIPFTVLAIEVFEEGTSILKVNRLTREIVINGTKIPVIDTNYL